MTNKELNKAIAKLAADIKTGKADPDKAETKNEYTRLYGADNEFKYMTAASIRIMIKLNNSFQFIPCHRFGMHIVL